LTRQHLIILVAGLAAALAVVVTMLLDGAAFRDYWARACTGKAWRRTFPDARSHEIRQFLHMLVDAFAFSRKRALQFAPTDRVLGIYRTLYPSKNAPDALELETFAKLLHKTYRFELSTISRENLTLGEIFARAARFS
jgi:propanediol dehydratase small subunit